jgi:hypothetical protein
MGRRRHSDGQLSPSGHPWLRAEGGDVVEVSFAPISERSEGAIERFTEWCERVLDSRWHLIVDLAVDDAIVLQLPELLGQHLLADPWQFATQDTEAARLSAQCHRIIGFHFSAHHGNRGLKTALEAPGLHDPILTHRLVHT